MRFGAAVGDGGVRFRIWAPDAKDVTLHIAGRGDFPLEMGLDGWAECHVAQAQAGDRYGFRVAGLLVPDPASRYQPDDVHGLSEVVDPEATQWADADWRGRDWEQAVISEIHIGTFTRAGTFRAAIDHLAGLAELGFTAIELMPLAEFSGRRGWGYDGALPFAPESSYGRPEDLKALVQAAHGLGLMVLLDVVYNHFGPDGNYLDLTARRFVTERHHTPWGAAINFDGAESRPVRDFFIDNALYWLREFHFDGLRLDAVHAIVDESKPNILEELARRVRDAIPERPIHLVLENDANSARLLARDESGRPVLYTAQWNDDFHHALHRHLTGESHGHYQDYGPDPLDHLGRSLAEGFAYQGEASALRGGRARGEASAHLPPSAFVAFLQNHDQIGNRALGERIDQLVAPEAVWAATAMLLLSPQPPMLFMGEEWGATTPFQFFCDMPPRLARAVRQGRRREYPNPSGRNPDPLARMTFARSRLDWRQRATPAGAARMARVKELLAIRRRVLAPRLAGAGSGRAARLGSGALRCQWRLGDGAGLILRANLSTDAVTGMIPEPGTLLYATHAVGGALPAWGVDWHLDLGG